MRRRSWVDCRAHGRQKLRNLEADKYVAFRIPLRYSALTVLALQTVQAAGDDGVRSLESVLTSTALGESISGDNSAAAGEGDEAKAAGTVTTPFLAHTAEGGPRRSSLSRSHFADPNPFPPSQATFSPRRSSDTPHPYVGKSHPYATAKNYFPLVKDPKKSRVSVSASTSALPSADPAQSSTTSCPPSPSPYLSTTHSLRRRTSVSSGLSATSIPAPALRERTASGPVFPTVARAQSMTNGSKGSSPAGSDVASTASGSTGRGQRHRHPADSVVPPVASAQMHSTEPPVTPQHASSITSSSRSTHSPRRTNAFKPSYTASLAPNYAEVHQATSSEPVGGPASIFLHPMPQPRSVTELLPKKKLSSLFSKGKSKLTGSNSGQSVAALMHDPTYRGKSATILDAALASSATWAQRRGEQSRMSNGSAFAPPAGYRPAHQVLRQQRERESAGGETPVGPAMMGGGTEQPVTGEAIAEAFARNNGRSASRRMSLVSLQSTADIASPASKAFPVRRDVFATKQRAQASGEGPPSVSEGPAAAVMEEEQAKDDERTEQKALDISQNIYRLPS